MPAVLPPILGVAVLVLVGGCTNTAAPVPAVKVPTHSVGRAQPMYTWTPPAQPTVSPPTPPDTPTAAPPTATPTVVQPAPAVVQPPPKAIGQVYVVGDSLTVGSEADLTGLLENSGIPVSIDAQVGRGSDEGIALFDTATGKAAPVWVSALGTNDDDSVDAALGRIDRLMGMAGGRNVLWLTLVRPGGDYGAVNAAVKQKAGQYPNLHIVDWASYVDQHPAWQEGDGVHLTADGYAGRAAYIVGALQQSCLAFGGDGYQKNWPAISR